MAQDRWDTENSAGRPRERRARRGFMTRFFSVSAGDILLLLIACVVVGFLLAMFGIDPRDFWADLFAWIGDGVASLRASFGDVFYYLLYGAMLVVPIWLLARLFRAMR